MLEIKITDPHTMPQEILVATAKFLLNLSGHQLISPPIPTPVVEEIVPEAPEVQAVEPIDLPWDERIHARTKSKDETGRWKLKRGVDPKLVERVTEELLTRPVDVTPPLPPVINAEPDNIPVSVEKAIEEPAAPDIDFPKVMLKITGLISNKKITRPEVLMLLKSVGIQDVPDMANHPDCMPAVAAMLDDYVTSVEG